MNKFRLAEDAHCPGCGGQNNAALAIAADEGGPKPGDLSVCGHCGALLEFTDEVGHVQHLAASMFKQLPLDTRKQLAHAQSHILRALKGGRL